MIVLGFEEYRDAGLRLAEELSVAYKQVDIHRFPDGEHRLTLPPSLPPRVVLCRSLFEPNEKLIDLLLLAPAARGLGARQLILVAPYLCYMRQDKAFHAGEVVSQPLIGRLLAGHFDALITVDPHMHRTPRLCDAVPVKQAINLSAAKPVAAHLRTLRKKPLLVGPDEESRQWVQAIAQQADLEFIVAQKRRTGDRKIEVLLPGADIAGRHCVLIDDIVSTGCTLARAADLLLSSGAGSVSCIATHILPAGGAAEELKRAGVSELLGTDSIPHACNDIRLASLLADAVRGLSPLQP